ncbi:MAG: acyl carrier protein [Thermoanaerobacterales bacterium]
MSPAEARALLARLLATIAPEVDLDALDPAVPIGDQVDLDSIDVVRLVEAVHDETGLDIPERDYPAVASVDGFVAYVVARTAQPADPS